MSSGSVDDDVDDVEDAGGDDAGAGANADADANAIDLGGEWLIRPDVEDRGLREKWWRRGGPAAKADEREWRRIELPCAWQKALGVEFHGIAWLRRKVHLTPGFALPGRRCWLRFESVATELRAWVNGVEVGGHVGDWAPFQLEVTEAIGREATSGDADEGSGGSGVCVGGELEIVLRIDEIAAAPPEKVGDLQCGHITKGFHDVVSVQHGGVWQPLYLKRTGALAIRPNGVWAKADARSGDVRVLVEFIEPARCDGRIEIDVLDGSGVVASGAMEVQRGDARVALDLHVPDHHLWSPADPYMYALRAVVREQMSGPSPQPSPEGRGSEVSDTATIGFGLRSVEVGGVDRGEPRIVLNGSPIMIRGVLHWGHEPDSIAPAPPQEQVRDEFARLKAMGFNAVCICMWYAPRWYYDLADEMGMLIWQEHPMWQSPMRDEDLPEYRRLYGEFFRRDRNHPSIVIVSATCEHPCFHPDLARWWWDTARGVAGQLPSHLLQVQTAFFKWADHARSDLHDEHTYDNSNRWVWYLEDVQHELAKLAPKPFAMGETISFTCWPDVPGLEKVGTACGGSPRALQHMRELEAQWRERYGEDTVARFRRQSERHALLGRKFQIEQFRRYPNHAAIVMNHLRDIPQCQCGFRDDLGRWRFEPDECRAWLGDVALLLETPDQRRGFTGGSGAIECSLKVANFGTRELRGMVEMRFVHELASGVPAARFGPVDVPRGEIRAIAFVLPLPQVDRPTRLRIEGQVGDVTNAWDLHVFPAAPIHLMRWPDSVVRMDGLPFSPQDAEPDEVERGYSRSYGLPVRDWICALPDPAKLLPSVSPWRFDSPIPRGARVVVTHRLTRRLLEFLRRGGRVLLFASKTAGGLGTSYEWLFGQAPLIVEEGPLARDDSEWIIDLLGYDLVRRYARVIPVEALGIADAVDPLVRLCYTHDQGARVKFFDQMFVTNVGEGVLIASSLDHSEDAGQHLLARMIDHLLRGDTAPRARIDPATLRRFVVE